MWASCLSHTPPPSPISTLLAFKLNFLALSTSKLLICDLFSCLAPRSFAFPLRFSYIITHKSFLHAKHIFCYFVPSAFYENLINLIKIPGALSTSYAPKHTHTHRRRHAHIHGRTQNYSPLWLKGLREHQRTRTTVTSSPSPSPTPTPTPSSSSAQRRRLVSRRQSYSKQ